MHAMLYTPAELAFVLSLAAHAVCDVEEHFKGKDDKALRRTLEAMPGLHMFHSSRVVPALPQSAADSHERAAAQADDDAYATAPLLVQLPADAMNGAADATAPAPRPTRVMWRDAARSAAAARKQTALEADPANSFADATTATPQAASGSAGRSSVAALFRVLALAAQWRGNSAARFVRAWLQVCVSSVCRECSTCCAHVLCAGPTAMWQRTM